MLNVILTIFVPIFSGTGGLITLSVAFGGTISLQMHWTKTVGRPTSILVPPLLYGLLVGFVYTVSLFTVKYMDLYRWACISLFLSNVISVIVIDRMMPKSK